MIRAVVLALACLAIGLASGLALAPRRAQVAAVREAPDPASGETPIDRACRAQLASVRAQLVICNARPAEPEPDASAQSPPKDPGWDEETRRLVKSGETNTGTVSVRIGCDVRMYQPGAWPPPGGPPPEARIVRMAVDGGSVSYPRDGGAAFFTPTPPAGPGNMYGMLCSCPDAGGAP